MGILDKATEFIHGNKTDSTSGRDESAIHRDDQQSYGGPTSGFDSTAERYSLSSADSAQQQQQQSSFGGGETQGMGPQSGSAGGDDAEWEDDDSKARRRGSTASSSSRRGDANAYSSSRGDFSAATGGAYGSTATPRYGAAEAGADGAFLGEREEDDQERQAGQEQRNNPFGEGRDEQPGYEGGHDERQDSSYGGGDRGVDFVASGGGSAYGDGMNEYGGAGRNNDGEGRSSYQPDQPSEQRDGYSGGERSAYP
ncbi:uncharacterized protein RHOBADRAFT_44815 [Rhodotorula graminis WP1]|uniref:Uncharacterized protein n=1 Tax=Rhodotorula graminis (strain WP1) TaxID=578459 RepID=A0A194S0S2_RHOGW|nr:uncharacterized protein RHOBADRAFT_44815 [Rhodotorula graminis WP1]KPV74328.1 hypothetical protein RHOBADRAFT_44815 [Rhodotorula graminis WP1]